MGKFLTDLPAERIAKYRLMAAHGRQNAGTAKFAEAKAAYATIAMAWEALIAEYERALDAVPEANAEQPEVKPQR